MQTAAQTIEAVIGPAFEGDAHALLMAVYKDAALALDLRVDAAKAAIRYEKPALAQVQADVEHRGDPLGLVLAAIDQKTRGLPGAN